MVTMGGVWDRAATVLAERAGVLAGIALPLLWLPALVQAALRIVVAGPAAAAGGPVAPPTGAAAVGLALLGLAVAVLAMLGHLALVAAAAEPALGRDGAVRLALRRLPAYLGVVAVLLAALALLVAPLGIAVAASYPSMAALRAGGPPPVGTGAALFISLYGLALLALLVAAQARLAVLAPVVVAERLGLRAIPRALRLTRGLTWRIVGAVLVFAVVAAVALLAMKFTAGVTLLLLLRAGGAAAALFLAAALVALVGCALAAVAAAFTARLYLAARDRGVPAPGFAAPARPGHDRPDHDRPGA